MTQLCTATASLNTRAIRLKTRLSTEKFLDPEGGSQKVTIVVAFVVVVVVVVVISSLRVQKSLRLS